MGNGKSRSYDWGPYNARQEGHFNKALSSMRGRNFQQTKIELAVIDSSHHLTLGTSVRLKTQECNICIAKQEGDAYTELGNYSSGREKYGQCKQKLQKLNEIITETEAKRNIFFSNMLTDWRIVDDAKSSVSRIKDEVNASIKKSENYINYESAMTLFNRGQYEDALDKFNGVKDYFSQSAKGLNVQNYIEKCQQNIFFQK